VAHLRCVIHEFVEHYHAERNHQGLRNVIPSPASPSVEGRIRRREKLGGLLSFYERMAA
jgi:putative transposase